MTESMVSANHYNALKLERDQLAARVIELEEAIKYSIDSENEPEYHDEGMGCGLEDRNITCRYEAMAHGWEKALERIYSEVMPPEDILRSDPTQSLLIHDAEVLEKFADRQHALMVPPSQISATKNYTNLYGTVRLGVIRKEATNLRLQAKEKASG